MFTDDKQAQNSCLEDPLQVFLLIINGVYELVDKLIKNKKIDINLQDEEGNNIVMALLKRKEYKRVLNYIKRSDLDINHQNKRGNTLGHLLTFHNYVDIMKILDSLNKRNDFKTNVSNNNNETIIDRAIKNDNLFMALKIMEYNNKCLLRYNSLVKIKENYLKSNDYGKYFKFNVLDILISLKPKSNSLNSLIRTIKKNYESIKEGIGHNNYYLLDEIMKKCV